MLNANAYNDFIIDDVLACGEIVDEVGRNSHDNHSADPLHNPGAEKGRAASKPSQERHLFLLFLKCGSFRLEMGERLNIKRSLIRELATC